jgi:SAM-dependent methyltransferase
VNPVESSPPDCTVVNEAHDIYYTEQYWNDLPKVLEYLCERYTGDSSRWWVVDFLDRYCSEPFERGLFLNCGNGWVEREFVDRRMVRHAVAFDYSQQLLEEAEKQRGDRAITYFQADCNRLELEPNQFDLIVNVAALHHVQYLDRLCRMLCHAIRDDGVLVNCDYIGPSRNQYSWRHWLRIRRANRVLPPSLRRPRLRRPHLATMLVTDPTEAIHSSLILDTVARYFDIVERHDAGGGIAYELLSRNPPLARASPQHRDPHIERVLALDLEATRAGKVPPLFSYFIARPRKRVLKDEARLAYWQRAEAESERVAERRRGVYSRPQYLRLLFQLGLGRIQYLWHRAKRRLAAILGRTP